MGKGVEILIKLNDQISKGLGVVNSSLHKTTQKLNDIENSAKSFEKLRTGALIAGGAIAIGLGMATHKAMQFESAIAPVKTVLSGTADEVELASARIGKYALSWSSQYKNSAEEYLGASYNLLSAGLNETQAIAGTNMALKLATATLGDATTSSALLGTLYNNFGNKANDANKEMMMLSDTVAKTQQLFQIANLGQLNEGLKYATASALSFRVSFDQTSAVVGQLNTLGLTGSMAGTSFNAMMGKLNEGSEKLGYTVAKTADGGIDLVKTLRNISSVGADADTIKKVFGDEGAKGVTLLTAKIGDLESNFKKVQQSAGATEVAFKKMFNSSGYQLDVFKNNFANLGTSMGKPIEEALLGVLLILNPILHGFNEFIAKNEWLAKIVVGLGVALSGLLLAFGSYVFWIKMGTLVTGFFGTIMTATSVIAGAFGIAMTAINAVLLANPIILIVAGVIALIAGIILLVKHWDTVKNATISFGITAWEWINKIADTFGILIPPIFYLRMGIQSIINIWKFFEGMLGAFKIGGIEGAINYLITAFHQGIENIKSMFSQLFSAEFWLGMFDNIKNWFFSLGEWIGKIWEKIMARDFKGLENTPLESTIPKNSEMKIQPKLLPIDGKGTKSLNKDILLPLSHTNFLAKNGLLGDGIQLPATSEMSSIIPNAGSMVKKTTAKININDKNKTSSANKSTVINIANIEIADGVISNLEDFILQLNQRVIV